MKRIAIIITLLATLICAMPVQAAAYELSPAPYPVEDDMSATITPLRYTHIREFASDGYVESGEAFGKGYAMIASGFSSKMVVTLERSSDGSRYTYYKTLASKTSTRRTIQTSGSRSDLSSDYQYRVKVAVYVYDDNKDVVDSDYVYYY